jgi:Xaa-Pro aminopeptidase
MYRAYQKACPGLEAVDISSIIRQIRMIKSAYEIACISRASAMADELFASIPRFLEESETELDLALRAEGFYRKRGHFGLVRFRGFNIESLYGHILAGSSGAVPSASAGPTGGTGLGPYCSQGAGRKKLAPGEPIMVDYVGSAEGYCSDQTRIFSIGPLPAKLQSVFEAMLEVQEALMREGGPGVKARDLYEVAARTARQRGVSQGFMGYPQGVPFVGHGVGLELDEWPLIGPRSDHVLAEGMVFALEPKCILPGKGVVGIENTFVVTEEGLQKLNRYPDAIVSC